MGREIRRVPPNWQHPTKEVCDIAWRVRVDYCPMYDRPFAPAMREWIAAWEAWERGERPDYCPEEFKNLPYWEWADAPPDPAYYRPDWNEADATWFQVYETVSEGTPVTPPFATREELVEYLVANGDFWDQKRREEGESLMRCTPWPREEAHAFVFGAGWAPSGIMIGGKMMTGTEGMLELAKEPTE